jgi:hypothetical protein
MPRRQEAMMKATNPRIERFAEADLAGLREDLLKSGLDSWQAAELISSFLAIRGYGVSKQDARKAAFRMEAIACSLGCLQEELEKIAQVM